MKEGSMNFFLSLVLAFCSQEAVSFELVHSRRTQEQSHRPLTDKQKERIQVIAQQAREAVAMLPRGEQKDQLAGQLAVMIAKSGDLATAREIVNSIADDGTRNSLFNLIVQAQAESGDISGALQAAAKIADGTNRSEAIQAVASAQANAHDFPGAFQTPSRLRDAPLRYIPTLLPISNPPKP